MSKIAIDTNILIHLLDGENSKRIIAEKLISQNPIVSAQVISEFINVSKRKLLLSKIELLKTCNFIIEQCEIAPVNLDTLTQAEFLIQKYDFQIFDAIIISTALQVHCDVLYTEDMHNGLVVDDKLRIVNPYL